MSDKTNELKQVLSAILDNTEDKDLISNITKANSLVDAIDKDNQDINSKYKELLTDYKDVIKHTSFKPVNNESIGVGLPKETSLNDIISQVLKKEN